MAEETKRKQKDKPADIDWKDRLKRAEQNQETLFKKFEKFYDIMYATFNTDNMAPWRSKVYIPILSSKAWDLISKFVNMNHGFDVSVRDELPITPEEEQSISDREEKAEYKLDFDFTNPLLEVPIKQKLFNCLMDAVVAGTGFAKVPWRVMKEKQYARPINDDNITVDIENEIVRDIQYGCNDIEPVNIFNLFIEPSATSTQTANWIMVRSFMPIYELKSRNEGAEIYKNIDDLKGMKAMDTGTFSQRNRSRNRLLGLDDTYTGDDTVDMVEIYECFDKKSNRIQTFVTGQGKDGKSWREIRDQKNVYWHGKAPYVSFHIRRKPYQFWGESLFENNERLQAATNDLFNHYLDNWNLSIDGMIMQDDTSVVDDFIVEPGGTLVYTGEEPKQFRFPEPNPQQLSLVMNEIDKAIEQATIPQFSSGIPDSSLDKTAGTATGIIRLQEAANDKIAFMRDNYMQSLMEIGNMWLMNSQQFMDRPITVSVPREDGKRPMVITPADLQGVLALRVDEDKMGPVSRVQAKQEHMEFVAHLLQLQTASLQQMQMSQNPGDFVPIDFRKLMVDAGKKFGEKQADRYIAPAIEQMPLPPQGVENG